MAWSRHTDLHGAVHFANINEVRMRGRGVVEHARHFLIRRLRGTESRAQHTFDTEKALGPIMLVPSTLKRAGPPA